MNPSSQKADVTKAILKPIWGGSWRFVDIETDLWRCIKHQEEWKSQTEAVDAALDDGYRMVSLRCLIKGNDQLFVSLTRSEKIHFLLQIRCLKSLLNLTVAVEDLPPVFHCRWGSEEYFQAKRAFLWELIGKLREQAGIAKEVEELESLFEPDWYRDQELAPFGTELRISQEKERDAGDRAAIRMGLRRIYFEVTDIDLRRRLIKKSRELKKLEIESCIADLRKAEKRLQQVQNRSVSLLDALGGSFVVLLGALIVQGLPATAIASAGVVGAIAGAVFVLLYALPYTRERDRSIALAEREVDACKERLRDECQEEFFSFREELGWPDQKEQRVDDSQDDVSRPTAYY